MLVGAVVVRCVVAIPSGNSIECGRRKFPHFQNKFLLPKLTVRLDDEARLKGDFL